MLCFIGLVQPSPTLYEFEVKDLKGIKIGVDWDFFNVCFNLLCFISYYIVY